jgi:mitochondrial fission protein ELM1
MKTAWVLTDGKAGHENQSKAFARALGCETALVPVAFRGAFAKALSYALDRVGVLTLSLFRPFAQPSGRPDVVIGTGSGTFYAAKALAAAHGVPSCVILSPRGYRLSSFGCVLSPCFDRPLRGANVVTVPANVVAADEAFAARAVEAFDAHYRRTVGRDRPAGRPAVAVVIGGPNACSTMSADWIRAELDRVFAAHPDAALWVTTSRRTPREVEEAVDAYAWDYKLVYSRDPFNPIPAFVSLADRLYVTAESTGMLSEACSCGRAVVETLDNLKPGRHKFRRFVEALRRDGYLGSSRKIDLAPAVAAARRLLGL